MIEIQIKEPGGPEVLVPIEASIPEPGEEQVLIEVEASGVNRPDVMQRKGLYPPPPGSSSIPGLEVSGTVRKLGKGANPDLLGKSVCALVSGGGYADWCVACQPIEHRILKDAEVENALAPYYLIKLDLSHYDASHQALLSQWDILGPPTYLILDQQHKEIRTLRLTGAFQKSELLQQLAQLKEKSS